MKKIYIPFLLSFALLLITTPLLLAQDHITLTFTGRDQYNQPVKLSNVFIENITKRWQEVLYYPDTVLNIGSTGIQNISSEKPEFHLFQNRPNPFDGETDFSLQLSEISTVHLEILDLNGKIMANYTGKLEQGMHLFKARLTTPQTYLLNTRTDDGVLQIKMVNTGHAGNNSLEYLGMGSSMAILEQPDNAKGSTLLPFTSGDMMRYKGYSLLGNIEFTSPEIQKGQYESEDIIFDFNLPLPFVSTMAASGIAPYNVQLNGHVSSDGGYTVTERGFLFADNANLNNASSYTAGTGTGDYSYTVSNLQPGTNYYYRAFASNAIGTYYGEILNFTTLMVLPEETTVEVSNITALDATCTGDVTYNGGGIVTARGICWNTSQNPTVYDSHTTNGSGTGSFTGNITGLTGGTTYYVRAYAKNNMGTAYGNQLSFTTLITTPTVFTNIVYNINANSADCGGYITDDGGNTVTARGVCWSTSQNPTLNDNFTIDGDGTGNFTSNITGLAAGTTYYVRAYATNSVGTTYGEQRSFTTTISTPIVTTNTVSNITTNSATCGGNVIADGGATIIVRGICWSTSQNPTVNDNFTSNGNGTGNFTSSITELTAGTTYYVRAYATNSIGTAYGEQRSFTTITTNPTVITNTVSNITATSASCGGIVTATGGASVTARGVCWSTSQSPTVNDNHTNNGSGEGAFTSNITGLSAGTTYYVRAYATNSVGTAYGELRSFATINTPTVTTNTVSNITAVSAVCGGNVTATGGAPVTACGVCWSTSPIPTINDNHTNNGASSGNFTSNITGLVAGTTYYVRAYATNSAGTAYGELRSFTTLTIPTVTTNMVNYITAYSATCGGNVIETGGSTVTARGVCWSTSPNPTIYNNHTFNGSGTGNFTSNLTGLNPNTTYYVRAYATNSAGTAYGVEMNFTTPSNVASGSPCPNTTNITDYDYNSNNPGGE